MIDDTTNTTNTTETPPSDDFDLEQAVAWSVASRGDGVEVEDLELSCVNGEMTIDGRVRDKAAFDRLTHLVENQAGVRSVVNHATYQPWAGLDSVAYQRFAELSGQAGVRSALNFARFPGAPACQV